MAIAGFCPECSKEPVPPREYDSVVAHAFFNNNGVMHAMHVRSNHEPLQIASYCSWQAHVGVTIEVLRTQPDAVPNGNNRTYPEANNNYEAQAGCKETF